MKSLHCRALAALLFCAFFFYGPANAQGRTFKGFVCQGDCSGHRAGYAWAARNGIKDPSQCSGNSQSFYEGCVAYAHGR